MSEKIILTAETGSDMTYEMAAEYGVYLAPMHVQMGDETLDDGAFPAENVCQYYDRTKKVPKTSAATPYDFTETFKKIREKYPENPILHLAYSAVTTCSYQNALLASEDFSDITCVDTKHVSVGQGVVVMKTAEYLKEHPDCSVEEASAYVQMLSERVQMCFIPLNLDYLRAGGRVSNATALVGNLLSLHPCIEIIDGQLLAKKKYRGNIDRIIPKLLKDFDEKHGLDRSELFLICTPRLGETSKQIAEKAAGELGFAKVTWIHSGCVITSHSGPGAIGIVGIRA